MKILKLSLRDRRKIHPFMDDEKSPIRSNGTILRGCKINGLDFEVNKENILFPPIQMTTRFHIKDL